MLNLLYWSYFTVLAGIKKFPQISKSEIWKSICHQEGIPEGFQDASNVLFLDLSID